MQVCNLLRSASQLPFSEKDFSTAIQYSFVVVAAYAPATSSNESQRDASPAVRVAYTIASGPGLVEGMQLVGFTR